VVNARMTSITTTVPVAWGMVERGSLDAHDG
jgi:hypothetical protein